MNTNSIFVCREASGDHWQLGPIDGALHKPVLIGWRVWPEPVEGGLPPAVTEVLAKALVLRYRVTGLSSRPPVSSAQVWTQVSGNWEKRLQTPAGSWLRFLPGSLPTGTLVCTRDSQRLVALLNDAGFPWSMQGQALLLCDPAPQRPPAISADDVVRLCGPNWTSEVVAGKEVTGVLRPGVDGDVAGLVMFDAKRLDAWLAVLQDECRMAGFEFEVVSYPVFVQRLQ